MPSLSIIDGYLTAPGSTADYHVPDNVTSGVITCFTALGNGGAGHAILVYQGNNLLSLDVDGSGYVGSSELTRIGLNAGDVVHVTVDVADVFFNVTAALSFA